jgi:hypothetical protein
MGWDGMGMIVCYVRVNSVYVGMFSVSISYKVQSGIRSCFRLSNRIELI